MPDSDALTAAFAELGGRPLDDQPPGLLVVSARQLSRADVENLVEAGLEDRTLLESEGLALEVVFTFEHEPDTWVWRFRVAEEDLPQPDSDLGRGEYLRGELTWRLIEWRDTRAQRRPVTSPHLLRAS